MADFDFDEDDDLVDDLHYEFSIGYDEYPTKDMQNRPVISYKYLCLEGDYSFRRAEFNHKEWRRYLEVVKEFSTYSLQELVDCSSHEFHFRLKPNYDIEHAELAKYLGQEIKKNDPPILGHFALYTTPADPKNPKKKLLSPRIFFLLGKQSVIHILFFDPYHEIHNSN